MGPTRPLSFSSVSFKSLFLFDFRLFSLFPQNSGAHCKRGCVHFLEKSKEKSQANTSQRLFTLHPISLFLFSSLYKYLFINANHPRRWLSTRQKRLLCTRDLQTGRPAASCMSTGIATEGEEEGEEDEEDKKDGREADRRRQRLPRCGRTRPRHKLLAPQDTHPLEREPWQLLVSSVTGRYRMKRLTSR